MAYVSMWDSPRRLGWQSLVGSLWLLTTSGGAGSAWWPGGIFYGEAPEDSMRCGFGDM